MSPIASPLAMSAVRAYEPDYTPSPTDIRVQAATRGHPVDAAELRVLRLIADGAARPGDPGGCCIALGLRGYVECADIGWRVTTQGQWFLDRVGRYAEPLHEIDRHIGEADEGARLLMAGAEIPIDAWDALNEARRLLAKASAQVKAALEVVQVPAVEDATRAAAAG